MKIQSFLNDLIEKKKEDAEDVLLIHVDSFYNLLYSFYNLGLLYIGTVLKEKGYRVRCIASGNIFFLNQNKMKSMIGKFSPRIVGFYLNSDNIHNVLHMARDMKKWAPGVRIVVGGPLATIMKERMLEHSPIDFVVVGEGEYPMLGLADYFIRGKGGLKEIQGIIYRQDDRIMVNERCAPIADLDELPPLDYSLIGVSFGFFYSSGRGCPHKCSFCFQEVHGKGYRFHSAERVVRDLVSNVVKYNAKTVNIVDDTFIAHPRRVSDICEGLVKERQEKELDFIFFCEGRVDIFDRHPELPEKLKEAGMARLQIGVETGNQEILDAYNKHITLEQIERVVEKLGRMGGVSVYGNFILGGPFETRETFEKTLAFAKKLLALAPGQFECASSFLCPFPGTEIGETPQKYDLTIVDNSWLKGLSMSDVGCTTRDLSVQELRAMEKEFEKEVYREMRRIAMSMEPLMMERHFNWAIRYKMHTLYYLRIFPEAPILESYFNIKKSARFRRLSDIPADELGKWFPLRISEKRSYTADGKSIELPGYFKKITITRPEEQLVYEYSAGKMNIQEIAGCVSAGIPGAVSHDEVVGRIMLPLYKRLEKSYHIIFSR